MFTKHRSRQGVDANSVQHNATDLGGSASAVRSRRRSRFSPKQWRYFSLLIAALIVTGGGILQPLGSSPASADRVIDPHQIVYRAALQGPDEVLADGGFLPRGMDGTRPHQPPVNISLYNHVGGTGTGMSRHDSGYVSTTRSRDFALRFVQHRLGGTGWVYAIHVTPNMINAAETLGTFYPHPEERELAALGGIRADQIIGWTRITAGVQGREVRHSGFNYRRYAGMTDGGDAPQLAGFPNNHPAWRNPPWVEFAPPCVAPQRSARSADAAEDEDSCAPDSVDQQPALDYMDSVSMSFCCSHPSAAFLSPGYPGQGYVTHGDQWASFKIAPGTQTDYLQAGPAPLTHWQAFADAGFDSLDAVLEHPSASNEAYVFSGTRYLLIDWSTREAINGPLPIEEGWPSLAEAGFTTVDAATRAPYDYSNGIFFSGNEYVVVDVAPGSTDDTVLRGPGPISDLWPGAEDAQFDTIDSVLDDPNDWGKSYFFSGDRYVVAQYNINIGKYETVSGPASINDDWLGIQQAEFFPPEN